MGGHNLHYPMLWGSSVVIIYAGEVTIFDMEARHASRQTQHNLRRVYAGHCSATTLVVYRHTVSPKFFLHVWEKAFSEATYFPATGIMSKKS
jgi:hypothetical protein